MKYKRFMFPIVFGLLLTAFSAFTLLDAFVIPKDIIEMDDLVTRADDVTSAHGTEAVTDPSDPADMDDGTENTSAESGEVTSVVETETETETEPLITEPIITENSYISNELSITITEVCEFDTQIYVADVIIKDASYFKTGLAKDAFGRNLRERTSAIAERCGAILAVNGDYYGFRDRGFVMRNGYLYRDKAQKGSDHQDLVYYSDGRFEIVDEANASAQELFDNDAVHIFSFGPGLVINGGVTVSEKEEVEHALRSNPRTAIGEIEPLHYVFVVSDGRSKESAGLTLYQLANVMKGLGCRNAYNFDGGGSATMWFMGRIINKPSDAGGERKVSDIVYIG